MMIPFYDCVSAVYSAQNSIRLNFSTDCNDGFVFAPLGAAGALAATAIASGSAEASMFKNNFSALTTNNDVCDIYYRYGNEAYPQSGVINRMNTLAELTNVSQWGDDYDQQSLLFVQNFIRGSTSASAGQYFLRDSFSQHNTVSYINVSGDRTAGWYDASLAGVSTRGLDVILVANYGGLANANDLLLFACNTSRAVFSPATGSVYCVR
jgi:hypothetical protein